MSAPATAVIQFIGLILFSSHTSTDQHLKAIVPRITGPANYAQDLDTKRLATLSATAAMTATGVEEHVAFISFRKSDFINAHGWEPEKLPTQDDMMFVRLNGEQISFSSSPLVRGLGIAGGSSPELTLRHLQPCCSDPKLRPEYTAPAYRLAAAVFDLSNGVVRACSNGLTIDAVARFQNDGTLVISAQKDGKKKDLRLR